MIIKREFNGKSYDILLTPDEMRQAYYEKQLAYDINEVEYFIDEYLRGNESLSDSEINLIKDNICGIALAYRQLADATIEEDIYWNCMNDAINCVAKRNRGVITE